MERFQKKTKLWLPEVRWHYREGYMMYPCGDKTIHCYDCSDR